MSKIKRRESAGVRGRLAADSARQRDLSERVEQFDGQVQLRADSRGERRVFLPAIAQIDSLHALPAKLILHGGHRAADFSQKRSPVRACVGGCFGGQPRGSQEDNLRSDEYGQVGFVAQKIDQQPNLVVGRA